MAELLLKRVPFGFQPADPQSAEEIKKIPVGKTVRVKWSRPRNVEHHRKWWAFMGLVAENFPVEATPEQICEKVKLGIGHFDWITAKLPGETKPVKVPVTRSISFAAMDQTQFEEFYTKGVRFIIENLWPTLTEDEIKRQVEEFAS